MRINSINNITRKALPLAAAAAISIGGFAACSSSKDNKQEPTYLQTEMIKLNNTLDSLKSARGEGDNAFSDYYEKSKNVVNNAQLDPAKAMDSKTGEGLTSVGIILGALGLVGMICISAHLHNAVDRLKAFNYSVATAGTGILMTVVGTTMQACKTYSNHKDFSNYKEVKLNELENEKLEHSNIPTMDIIK